MWWCYAVFIAALYRVLVSTFILIQWVRSLVNSHSLSAKILHIYANCNEISLIHTLPAIWVSVLQVHSHFVSRCMKKKLPSFDAFIFLVSKCNKTKQNQNAKLKKKCSKCIKYEGKCGFLTSKKKNKRVFLKEKCILYYFNLHVK